jgi:hypothetical protein
MPVGGDYREFDLLERSPGLIGKRHAPQDGWSLAGFREVKVRCQPGSILGLDAALLQIQAGWPGIIGIMRLRGSLWTNNSPPAEKIKRAAPYGAALQ